jgi:hypothetical protein
MRRLLLLLIVLPLLGGCNGLNPLFPWLDADGHYEGYVDVCRPIAGFNHSFDSHLRIWDNCNRAEMTDVGGHCHGARYIDYNYWTDELEIVFEVIEARWDSECGNEIYHWEMRLIGDIDDSGDYQGRIELDIDPEDYESDNCYLSHNPCPEYMGTFDFGFDW